MSSVLFKRKYDDIMTKLYPLLEFAAYNAINKKVQRFSNSAFIFNSNIADGMNVFKDDLMNYAISSIIDYIPKIDASRERISDILWVIAKRSSQIYLYSTLIEPRYRFIQLDAFDPDNIDIKSQPSFIDEGIQDDEDESVIHTIDDIKLKFSDIYKLIYSDLENKKISIYKFYKYSFINKLLFMYLLYEKDVNRKNPIFKDVYSFAIKFRNKYDDKIYLAKILLKLYKIYKENYLYETKYIFKIGFKLILEFLNTYMYQNVNINDA